MDLEAFKQPGSTIGLPTNQKYKLRGANAVDYAIKEIEKDNCLLADRYLTRRSGMFFVAPSGQGKSTAAMQSMICWACGQPCFDIEPARPLRITMIQAEDDDADLRDMAKMVDHLGLSAAQKTLVAKNSWIETLNDRVNVEAIARIDQILAERPCDLFILNPYLAYLGADSKDEAANSIFLRAHFQGLLNRRNCAALIIHHTPKTNFRQKTETWSIMDWMYSGAGAAVLTNWARAILAMDPVGESGVFKFIAAKRGQRIGWDNSVNHFKHDNRPGVLLWTKATALEVAAATSNGRSEITSDQVIEAIPVLDGISMMRLRKTLEQKGATQRNAKVAIEFAIEDGLIHTEWLQGNGHATRVKMIYRRQR
jgi:hypothetical protein